MKYANHIEEAIEEASSRSRRILSLPSFLSDEDWREAMLLLRGAGQELSGTAKGLFTVRRDAFAKTHGLDLIMECERLYEIVRLLAEERANRTRRAAEPRGGEASAEVRRTVIAPLGKVPV
jgi:hypothetical protein